MSSIDTSTPRSESANLDFLRAVAVLAVFFRHVLLALRIDPSWPMGQFGVLLFFVHTSLVLMMSLERIERSGHSLFKSFYIRRWFRIYPLSMACVGLVVLFHLPVDSYHNWFNPNGSAILANLLLCTNLFYQPVLIGVLWTLPLEVQMYVLLPFVYLVGRKYRIQGIAIVWVVAIAAAVIQPHIAGRLNVAQYVPCFLAGAASYFLGFGVVRRRLPFIGWPITIAAAAGTLAYFRPTLTGSCLMCLMIGLTAPLFAELQWAPLRKFSAWIARYSYGIYLVHLYGVWLGIDVLKNHAWWVRAVSVVAVSFGLPVVLFHILESPMMKLGSRLANWVPARRGKLVAAIE
jgi:peptidoglycan/LPS O-acetylase OafA/YrhL